MSKGYVRLAREKIRRLCRYQKPSISMHELARRIDKKWEHLAPYLQGKSNAHPDVANAIAGVLGVTIDDVITAESINFKRLGLDMLEVMKVDVELGEESLLNYMRAWGILAPYMEAKVFGSGGFNAQAFAEGIVRAQEAIKAGEVPEGMSEAEAQELALSLPPEEA